MKKIVILLFLFAGSMLAFKLNGNRNAVLLAAQSDSLKVPEILGAQKGLDYKKPSISLNYMQVQLMSEVITGADEFYYLVSGVYSDGSKLNQYRMPGSDKYYELTTEGPKTLDGLFFNGRLNQVLRMEINFFEEDGPWDLLDPDDHLGELGVTLWLQDSVGANPRDKFKLLKYKITRLSDLRIYKYTPPDVDPFPHNFPIIEIYKEGNYRLWFFMIPPCTVCHKTYSTKFDGESGEVVYKVDSLQSN